MLFFCAGWKKAASVLTVPGSSLTVENGCFRLAEYFGPGVGVAPEVFRSGGVEDA